MSASLKRVIVWFRRDLRIKDHTALNAAHRLAEEVIPVYVLSDWKKNHAWTGAPRQQFLVGCLNSLEKNIETTGGKLIFREGKAVDELEKLIRDTEADGLFFNREPGEPYGQEMEKKVREMGNSMGIEVQDFKDAVMHEADEVLTGSGSPYKVYTPYWKSWRDQDKEETDQQVRTLYTPSGIQSLKCPTLKTWGLSDPGVDFVDPGEKAARKRMKTAIEGPLQGYAAGRNTPAGQTTSRLSQDLRFGLISVRELYHRVRKASDECGSAEIRKSYDTFLSEIAWREFYMAILSHWPEVFETEFNPRWRGLWWAEPDEAFERFKEGKTGFPIVDAGVRELRSTGFMHNRVRMIVAMFLTKDLHISWREGEKFFMQWLVDGESASNNGGWQWSAGTGADAAPYFRIQNPWSQTERYDPNGEYIRKWVPELADVDARALCAAPKDGKPLVKGYVAPMVDHKEERERTLQIFKDHKGDG